MSEAPRPDPIADLASSAESGSGAMGIEEFTTLASKLANLGLYRDAIGLYETATRLHPDNIALKINLARVRDMKRRADRDTLKELDSNIRAAREREDLLANHYTGLGYLHFRRGDTDKAREFFEFARVKNDTYYLAPLYLAKIAMGRNERTKAIEHLEQARRANPFHEETLSLLGRLYMERGDNIQALHAIVDALVLSGETELAKQPAYQEKLKELLKRVGKDIRTDLPEMLRDRTMRYTGMAEKLERRRREALQERASERLHTVFAAFSAKHLAEGRPSDEVAPFRRFEVFERIETEDLLGLIKRFKRQEYATEQIIFTEGGTSDSLYLVDKGVVKIRKMTPFGEHILATVGEGSLFGEMNFLDGRPHSADAVAMESSTVYSLVRHQAEELLSQKPHIAVQLLNHFWKTLAQRIRDTNEQMKTFFVSEAMNAEKRFDEKRLAEAEKVIVDINKKIALFKEKGLTGNDLRVLASLSSEERYGANDLIFQEGDQGSKLYIVLDGRVRISKMIPGVGEEALAILERGDFFGEMALVDDKPRSADARAHEDRTTVIAIDKGVLDEILSRDIETAQQFLSILCRILAQRLREINETIVKWKIMAGGF